MMAVQQWTVGCSMGWNFGGGRTQGQSHIQTETPCQDYFSVEQIEHDQFGSILIFVVSDGAGNSRYRYTARGSRLVCQYLTRRVKRAFVQIRDEPQLSEDELRGFLWDLQSLLKRYSQCKDGEITSRDFAATCCLGIVSTEGLQVLQVGDGAVLYSAEDPNKFLVAISPIEEKGETYNASKMATSTHAYREAQYIFIPGTIGRVAAFSDGLINFMIRFRDNKANSEYLAAIFDYIAGEGLTNDALSQIIETTLADEATLGAVSVDDKSLVLAALD